MYSLLHIHSTFSTLDGFGTPLQNAKRAKELGLKALSLSDHGSVSGLVEHHKACRKIGIKSIKGCELYICYNLANIKEASNKNRTHMVIWANNKQGWHDLIKLISQTNHPDYFYYKPRIHLWDDPKAIGLQNFLKGNISGCSGHHGSILSDILFADFYGEPEKRIADLKKAYTQHKGYKTEDYRKFLRPDWFEAACDMAKKLEDLFGKNRFWIELQDELNIEDKLPLYIQPLIVECLRKVAAKTGIPSFASSDPHYPRKEDAVDQRATVMIAMKETEQSVAEKLTASDELDLMVFFGSENFYIHSYEEMIKKFTKEELEESNKIADLVEDYEIAENPYIPDFKIPKYNCTKSLEYIKNNADRYMMHLCVEGAKIKKPWENSDIPKIKYWERLKSETDIIFQFGLSNYFLVVRDICKAADFRPENHSFDFEEGSKNIDPVPRSVGRGSAANCLISYFLDITGIDPVKHNLIFSRFFNAGRLSKDNISLPDIDNDFSVEGRDWVLDYITHKYGQDKVGQIITFMTIKGKAAIKDIFRINDIPNGFDIGNAISECIESEHVIAEEIEQRKKDGDENYNILRYTLEHSDNFRKFYEDETLKKFLDQAMRCEGVKRGSGRHPSGVVVANKPLNELFPMVYDARSKKQIVGFDLKSAETLGCAKFDILGVAMVSKLAMTEKLIKSRTNNEL